MSLSLSVLSQSGPPKSVGLGGGEGGSGGGRIPHFMRSILYRGGNFFCETRGKIGRGKIRRGKIEKSIESGLEVQKFSVVCLFWGGCHHPIIHNYEKTNFDKLLDLSIKSGLTRNC